MDRDPRRGSRYEVSLFLAPPHPCSYLPSKTARYVVVDPRAPLDGEGLQQLMDQGFRRGGDHLYRPFCPGCTSCISLRVPVAEFQPDRSQRRCWRQGQRVVTVRDRPAAFYPSHYELYLRYQEVRHPEGSMGEATEQGYYQFLASPWCDTRFWELHLGDRFMAVAVVDRLPRGLSAVYTFFDPDLAGYSPGTLAVLWQIAEAARCALPYVYLGFWVQQCRKMSYKDRFRPLEAWDGKGWRRFGRDEPIAFV